MTQTLLTRPELAESLGVSVSTISKWMRQRRIPFLKLSPRMVRFEPSQVREQLAAYTIASVAKKGAR